MFSHEKLTAYAKALAWVSVISNYSDAWDRKHAVVDHLTRAGESVILNLAEAARLHSGPAKIRSVDYAIGSALECAACLDILEIKSLLSRPDTRRQKANLCEISRMLFGLRRTWESWKANDCSSPEEMYRTLKEPSFLFYHEQLDVYQVSLDLLRWLAGFIQERDSIGWRKLYEQLDEAFTSIALNVAEGNGRYSELDHHRFLNLAGASAVKAAALLDLGSQRRLLLTAAAARPKALLERVVAMLTKM